jgi:ribosomal-protein-alanine N-acetyltransferase
MLVETERLILRDFEERDAATLLELKYDKQVMEYHPTFIKRDATIDDAKDAISFFQSVKDKGDFDREIYFAIALKSSGTVIGAITVSKMEYLYETQIGWMMKSEYTGKGYASEAGAAASDYLLDAFSFDYLSVAMDVDNPASFRTAQKSGFRLFEKRVPYDYHYSKCNVEDFNAVSDHFAYKQSETGSCYYYFRKFNKNSRITSQFYGDTKYDGRFS